MMDLEQVIVENGVGMGSMRAGKPLIDEPEGEHHVPGENTQATDSSW